MIIFRVESFIFLFFLVYIMKISFGKCFLICEILINEKYKGMIIGLMGNFDGNKINDFILLNGIMFLYNVMNSERKIFYNFG